MRVWSWAAAAALIAVTAVSCLDRSPSHRANAQATPSAAQEPAAKPSAPAENAKTPSSPAAGSAANAEAAPEETTHEIILEHADRVRYDNKTKDYSLTGGVVLRHEDGVLRAQTVQMNSETKQGFAVGDLSFADQQTTLTANRMEIDFDARTAVFKGDVRMVTQKKPEATGESGETAQPGTPASPGADTKQAEAKPEAAGDQAAVQPKDQAAADAKDKSEKEKPFKEYWQDRTEIRCPELEYSYREHRAVARGGITARQKDRTGRADEAVYTDRDELLVLSGNVEMKNERGETFRAKKITISVKEDWLEAEGAIGSRFLVDEEKEGEGKGGEKAPAAGKGAEGKAPSPPAPAGAPVKEGAGG